MPHSRKLFVRPKTQVEPFFPEPHPTRQRQGQNGYFVQWRRIPAGEDARWIVEAWKRLLANHFRIDNPQDASIVDSFRFDDLPAMMRVRVTTPNVLKALRKRDPGAAKPYNFAHSPILLDEVPECTLVAPASKRSKEWLTRDYTEIHTGDVVKLGSNIATKLSRHKLFPTQFGNISYTLRTNPLDPAVNRAANTRVEC